MKEIKLESDLTLICVQAKSFPQGIPAAFTTLECKISSPKERDCYGIYEENENGIIYRAGFLKKQGEDFIDDLESYIIPKGEYLSIRVDNWKTNTAVIGQTFDKLFEDNRVDKASASIEFYKEKNELLCMVRMKDLFKDKI